MKAFKAVLTTEINGTHHIIHAFSSSRIIQAYTIISIVNTAFEALATAGLVVGDRKGIQPYKPAPGKVL